MGDEGLQDKSRILIVDDDADFVRLLHFALSRNGYHVERALNGAEGLSIADEFRPHVVITDLMMPGIDGTAFCQELKSRPHLHPVYVIMLTARGGAESQVSNLRVGADDYVVKPAGMRTLRARIDVGLRWVAAQGQLRWLAHNDSLTALPNRHMLDQMLEYEMARAMTGDRQLSLILVDLDRLKQLNDDFGHAVGDVALRRLADIIREHVRTSDFPARYGGDEFAIVLPCADREAATMVAQRVRQAVAEDPWPALGDPLGQTWRQRTLDRIGRSPTVSVGVASLQDLPNASASALMRAADTAAYRAKRCGRDQVYVFSLEEPPGEQAQTWDSVGQEPTTDRQRFPDVLRQFVPRFSLRDVSALELVARSLQASGVGWVTYAPDRQVVIEASVGLEGEAVHRIVSSLCWEAEPGDILLSTTSLVVVTIEQPESSAENGVRFYAVSVPAVAATGQCMGGIWLAWEQPTKLDGVDWLGLRWLARLLALELEMEPTPFPGREKGMGPMRII